MDPKVSEKPHAASEEDELANLLKDSLAQFDTTRNDSPEHGGPMENVDPPHKKWLAPFKKARHPDRKAKVFKPIARNLDKIQMVMEGVGFIIKSVSTYVPMVAPAALVVSALTWVVESFAKVSVLFNKIESFLAKMADKFDNLSLLRDIQEPVPFQLKSGIVKLFCCSLQIYCVAMECTQHRFRTWFDVTVGDDPLDERLREFERISDSLRETTSFHHYARTDQLHTKIDGLQRRQTSLDDRDRKLNCLSSSDFHTTYNSLLARVHGQPDAGSWMLRSFAFGRWRDGDVHKLWYYGKPGAGKSILATIAIRDLKEMAVERGRHRSNAVTFLYISYRNFDRNVESVQDSSVTTTVQEYLGSIARQLLSHYYTQSLPVPEEVDRILSTSLNRGTSRDSPNQVSIEEAERVISLFALDDLVYIVVDALDECQMNIRKELMGSLRRIEGSVKIMVTARRLENQAYLSEEFLQEEIAANQSDLEGFIDATLRGNEILASRRNDIQKTVTRKAQGIFLLARLHMDALDEVVIESKITEALEQLPDTIDDSYKNSMDRIRNKSGERGRYAYDIMAWVSYAFRALTVEELQIAIASRDLADETRVSEEMLFPAKELSAYCCGLVVEDEAQSVRFVHYSARDYFTLHREELFPSYHLIAAFSCIKYILSIPPEHDATADNPAIEEEDAVETKSINASPPDSSSEEGHVSLEDTAEEWATGQESSYCPVVADTSDTELEDITEGDGTAEEHDTAEENSNGSSASEDIGSDSENSIRRRTWSDYDSDEDTTPKQIASQQFRSHPFLEYSSSYLHRHYRNIRELAIDFLTYGGKSKTSGKSSEISHQQLVSLIRSFLEGGHSITYSRVLNAQGLYFRPSDFLDGNGSRYRWRSRWSSRFHSRSLPIPPLHLAVFLGCTSLVEQFISSDSDLDIDAKDEFQQSALVISFKQSFGDIASILLHRGANVDLNTKRGLYLLLFAAQKDHKQAVGRILTRFDGKVQLSWADLFIFLLSPVLLLLYLLGSLAAFSALATFAKALVDHIRPRRSEGTPDSESFQDDYGRLLFLANSGEFQALQSYVGTLGNIDPTESAPLTTNSNDSNEHEDSDDTESDFFVTPDGLASRRMDFLEIACFLAVEQDSLASVEVLLDAGVQIEARDYEGQTLLHRATYRNSTRLVSFLLARGAEVDAMDVRSRTALMANADMRHVEVLRLLRGGGARIDRTYEDGVHEIYRAAAHGKVSVVEFFLSNGLDASIYGINGWTPLHAAAANGHRECVQLLLQHGAKPSAISDTGKTPLDFVEARETLYDLPLLDESHEECEAYRKEHEDYPDLDTRMEEIYAYLRNKGAETSNELYRRIGEREFKYGEGGKYTHGYYRGRYQEEIDDLAATRTEPC